MVALDIVFAVQTAVLLIFVVVAIENSVRSSAMNRHLARIANSLSGLESALDDFIHRETVFLSDETFIPPVVSQDSPIVAESSTGGPTTPRA